MAKTRISGQDAIARTYMAKIGYQECVGNEQQIIVSNGTINNSTGVTSKDFGNPEKFNVMISATVAATFAVWHSHDGVKFFHDTANDIVFGGAADKVVSVIGANFIRFIPTVAQTTGAWIVATAIY
jgi:hypothetical protein